MLVNIPSAMILILSPAKTLDLTPLNTIQSKFEPTIPNCNKALTRDVANAMKRHAGKGKTHVAKLLGVSANIAATACQYWTDYSIIGENEETESKSESDMNNNIISKGKPAIFTFSGAAYQGLDVNNGLCENNNAMEYLQSSLRIIDPLYGSLRPLDSIQAYRLEMATKNIWDGANEKEHPKALSKFWKEAVTESISSDLKNMDTDTNIVVNLASDEYSAAVDESSLPSDTKYVKCVFKNDGRVIAVHAKKARGMMVRYLAENNVMDIEGIQNFDMEGYAFVESASSDDEIVFDREKPQPAAKKSAAATKKRTSKTTAKSTKKRRNVK